MRIAQLVTTRNFAGTERYACNIANEFAARGLSATVIGGERDRTRGFLNREVRWLPGASAPEAVRSLIRLGAQDIVHAHLTLAEAIALTTRGVHRAPVVSTRHFAARRGKTRGGQLLAPWIGAGLTREIAISEFVAAQLERAPDAVLPSGVPPSPSLLDPSSRVVLVAQRLEPEKDTWVAIEAFAHARMAQEGWTLRILGDGSERARLEHLVREQQIEAVTFAGWSPNVGQEFARAGMFLATAPAEPLGLGVLEAMAAGIPVAATAGGGHLETVGRLRTPRLFNPGDAIAAAAAVRSYLPERERLDMSTQERELVAAHFTIARHVDELLPEYQQAIESGRNGHRHHAPSHVRSRTPSHEGEL